ncbi:MAG: hypothetical protein AAB728_00760 [Patescibacteria group bacterium]
MENLNDCLSYERFEGDFFLTEDGYSLDFPWKKKAFIGAHISGGSLTCSLFEDCTFKNTTFENIFIEHVDFVRCHFDNFRIINCAHEGMEMRKCTGSPPTLIGTKAPSPGWQNKPLPPDWGSEADEAKR